MWRHGWPHRLWRLAFGNGGWRRVVMALDHVCGLNGGGISLWLNDGGAASAMKRGGGL